MNPWLGCEKVSPGCAHCYAETLAEGRMGLTGDASVWGKDAPRRITADSTWRKPISWNRESATKGRERFGGTANERIRVFCASMADVFEERSDLEVPRRRLLRLISETPALDWLILTKRPEFARDWLRAWYEATPFPEEQFAPPLGWVGRDHIHWGMLPNIWIGASIENARFTWRADVLREFPAAVRFISAEPLLGSLFPPVNELPDRPDSDLVRDPDDRRDLEQRLEPIGRNRKPLDLTGIDWVIVGGESGGRKSRPMRPEWVREIRDEAFSREIPLHLKQIGSYGFDGVYRGAAPKSSGKTLDGQEWCEFPRAWVVA